MNVSVMKYGILGDVNCYAMLLVLFDAILHLYFPAQPKTCERDHQKVTMPMRT